MKGNLKSSMAPRRRRRWGVLFCAAAVVGVVALPVWFGRQAPAPSNNVIRAEVASAELTLRDGRLWLADSGSAYTGWMLERYSDGSLRSRSEISNGVLHGRSEGWHTNGQRQVLEQFRGGVSDGVRTKWYASGARLSEVDIVRGRIEGTFRRWHENGHMAEEARFSSGKPEGVARAWYPSGFLKSEVTLRDGHPVERRSWRDGENSPELAQARSRSGALD